MFELAGVPGAARPRGDASRRSQASDQDEVRSARGRRDEGQELRDLTDTELAEQIDTTLRKELFGLRFQHATGELDNTAGLARAKRELARALTVARERELRAPPTCVKQQAREPNGRYD